MMAKHFSPDVWRTKKNGPKNDPGMKQEDSQRFLFHFLFSWRKHGRGNEIRLRKHDTRKSFSLSSEGFNNYI